MAEEPRSTEPGHREIHAVAGPELFTPSDHHDDEDDADAPIVAVLLQTSDGTAVAATWDEVATLLEDDPDLDPEALADAVEEQAVLAEVAERGGMPEEARQRLAARRAARLVPLADRLAERGVGDLSAEPDTATPRTHADGRPRGIGALIPDHTSTPSGPLPGTWVGGRVHHAGEPIEALGYDDAWSGLAARRREPAAEPEDAAALPILGRHRLEADWLVTPTTRVLHHAPLSDAECAELLEHEYVARDDAPTPFRLSCERTAWALARPNRIERTATPRCEDCCQALGYPAGHGSPQADPAAEQRLLQRLGEAS